MAHSMRDRFPPRKIEDGESTAATSGARRSTPSGDVTSRAFSLFYNNSFSDGARYATCFAPFLYSQLARALTAVSGQHVNLGTGEMQIAEAAFFVLDSLPTLSCLVRRTLCLLVPNVWVRLARFVSNSLHQRPLQLHHA